MALNLEIMFKFFSKNQNSANGIYDLYQVVNDTSHKNPGTSGTKLKVSGNNLQILCLPIRNWLCMRIEFLLRIFSREREFNSQDEISQDEISENFLK